MALEVKLDKPDASFASTTHTPPLIGRDTQLARLREKLARAEEGSGSVVFLTGEAGIGKTRLAREALARAQKLGFTVLQARAFATEGSLGYALIIQAVGPFLRGLDPVRQLGLVGGLADLGRLFPGLRLPRAEPLRDPALEKTRLFEAVARLMERVAVESPVLLVLDDLHWADPASLEMLHYLARGLAGQPALLLGTYATEAADRARGLRALLNSLRRVGLLEEIDLPRLTPTETAALAGAILGGEAPPELLTVLDARAAGTPLIAEALVHALLQAGALTRIGDGWAFKSNAEVSTPSSVREMILERLDRLAPADRLLLDLIAVAGGEAPHAVLREAAELDEPALLASVGSLRVAGLVAERADGLDVEYAVSHPAVQEAAYGELPEMARRAAHAKLALAFEHVCPGDLNRLAQHYRSAGSEVDPDRAVEVLLAAAERAQDSQANDDAARYYGAALPLVRHGHRAELLPVLLERLGQAWERVGEGGAATAVWDEAVAAYDRAGDAESVARVHRLLAMAEWDRANFESAQSHLAAGLSALEGMPPSEELLNLHHACAVVLGRLGDLEGLADEVAKLRALGEEMGSRRALAEACYAELDPSLARRDYRAAAEKAVAAVELAEAAEAPLLAQRAHDMVARIALSVGDCRLARAHSERSLEIARRLGTPMLELFARCFLAMSDMFAGDWDSALRRCAETEALVRRVGQSRGVAYSLLQRAIILAYRGDLDEADSCVSEARGALGAAIEVDQHVATTFHTASAVIALEAGDVERMLSAVENIVGQPEVDPSAVLPLRLALLAQMQACTGHGDSALATARELTALYPEGRPYPAALAARAEGHARQALGEYGPAVASFARAAELFAKAEVPFEASASRLEWAALVAASQPDGAAHAAQKSLAVFERVGALRYVGRARRLLRDLGVRVNSAHRSNSHDGPLSTREVEVARLVAQGLSNAEVAERLVVSRRTVTTHLEHIYARLGISSRLALARYMDESRLLAPSDANTYGKSRITYG